jgi:hypothetical protein
MKSKDLHLQVLLDEELAHVCGGMDGLSQASTAQAMKAAYDSLNYKYIGDQFRPVVDQTIAGAVAGAAIGKSLPHAAEGAATAAIYGATTTLLTQDFSKWVKPEPPKPSWADFRRMDNRR